MAAPSLQDILAKEPALVAKIDAMTELIPGVPASKENLKTLLEHVMKSSSYRLNVDDDSRITFYADNLIKTHFLVSVFAKAEEGDTRICFQVFPCTEDGLLEGLIYAKQNRKRYREEGCCPDCDSPGDGEPPRKKLKAKGMPKCEQCMLKAIVM